MFKLSSETYKNSINKGFSVLQQQQEFVDVTLVAEGCLVKAHQNILALASPYVKEILKSVPCQHPVIFFSNIDHKTLSYILEYIYTGEVQIPRNIINSFIKAAKEMQLTGIQDLIVPRIIEPIPETNIVETNCAQKLYTENNYNGVSESAAYVNDRTSIMEEEIITHYDNIALSDADSNTIESHTNISVINTPSNNKADSEMLDFEEILNKTDNFVPIFKSQSHNDESDSIQDAQHNIEAENTNNESELFKINFNIQTESIVNDPQNVTSMNVVEIHDVRATDPIVKPMYCQSIRGNLQMICNRFMYNIHHQSAQGHKRRWRCIEYRKLQCLAYIDTLDENIISRKHQHNHPYHDKKIYSLNKKKRIFKTITKDILRKKSPTKPGDRAATEQEIIFDIKSISSETVR